MALPKLFNLITWHNNTTPAINEDNLNAMSQAIDDIDDRVIGLAGTIMEDVPQIQEDIEELEEDFALIDEKIADATSEANRATTKANEAAASVISAGDKALVSEGWAKGTQNGVPVGPTSPYHNNNSEYFMNLARSFTPEGYQDLVDDVAEAQEAITDIEGEKVSSNDAYVLRQCKGNSVDLGLVGGSIAWNQLITNGNFSNGTNGWSNTNSTFTASGNTAHVTASAKWGRITQANINMPDGHKMLLFVTMQGDTSNYYELSYMTTHYLDGTSKKTYGAIEVGDGNAHTLSIGDSKTSGWSKFTVENVMLFDLTQMFGSTIADYIYSLEQATAGAGVAWFRKYFSNLYYGYDVGSIQSVNPSSRKVYDSDNNLIATYPFDSTLQLRGIPKLVNNKLSYDGDIYTADGTVTRKYGIVDLGTLAWNKAPTSSGYRFQATKSDLKNTIGANTVSNVICALYPTTTPALTWEASQNKGIASNISGNLVLIADPTYDNSTAEQFKTAMSGVYLVYELATPTTESANAYQNPQRAFIDGTEEFVDAGVTASTRDVSIPVGNESEYNTSVVLPISQDYTDGAMEILKEIVASSSDFADFKTKVAAL